MNVAEIQKLVVRIVADATGLEKGMENASKRLDSIGKKAQQVGKSLSLKVTAPVVGFGAASLKAFGSFDDAMTKSTAIMNDMNPETFNRMADAAKGLAKETTTAPAELAEAYFFLASAGMNAEQSIKALPIAQRFATAGAFDMATATDLLTDAQSALGLSVDDVSQNMENMTRVSDVLLKANTLANATAEQFSTALTSKAGAALKVFNKDVEEGVAVLAAYADQGVKAELAGNNLDRVTRLLSKSALDNAEAHKQFNFEVFDGEGKMRNYADIIANLEDVTAGMSDETRAATLDQLGFKAQVQGAILPLLGTSDAIAEYESKLRKAGGTTKEVAEKQMASLNSQVKLAFNELKLVSIEIGERLAPAFLKLVDGVKALLHWWDGLPDTTQNVLLALAGVAATVGPIAIVFGKLAIAASASMKAFIAIKGAIAAGGLGALAFKGALVALVFVIAYKLTSALTGASAAYAQFERSQRKADEQTNKTVKMQDRRFEKMKREMDMLMEGEDKLNAYNDAVARQKKEYEGTMEGVRALEKRVAEYNTTFNNMVGNRELKGFRDDLKRQKELAVAAERRLHDLQDTQHILEMTTPKKPAAAVPAMDPNQFIDDGFMLPGEGIDPSFGADSTLPGVGKVPDQTLPPANKRLSTAQMESLLQQIADNTAGSDGATVDLDFASLE